MTNNLNDIVQLVAYIGGGLWIVATSGLKVKKEISKEFVTKNELNLKLAKDYFDRIDIDKIIRDMKHELISTLKEKDELTNQKNLNILTKIDSILDRINKIEDNFIKAINNNPSIIRNKTKL